MWVMQARALVVLPNVPLLKVLLLQRHATLDPQHCPTLRHLGPTALPYPTPPWTHSIAPHVFYFTV